ncbi:MAG: type II toxin-antitoxin system VapC family toxin [Bacteroidia bacterium]|nr:type II toxin-antitoxin system VapC family toxin [Bacteroidia bacterium]
MQVLLDSHVLIWLYLGDQKLSTQARNLIESSDSECFMSLASVWEIAIKSKLGKINIGVPVEDFVADIIENGIQMLRIDLKHILATQRMEFHHRDPFDRLLFAQAIVENMVLISADEIADVYFEREPVKRVW